MATINIGNLTFTHKGDYDGSTAYAKNDVVYYSTNGNAYIAKQATTGNVPTNATYWNQFAQGSGGIWNAGLSLGSASQNLRVNSGGNALEFYTPAAASTDVERIVSGSVSATELIVDNCFTTAYEIYELHLYNIKMSSYHRLQFRDGGSSGSNITASDYRYRTDFDYRTSGGTSETGENAWSDTSFRLAYDGTSGDYGHHQLLMFAEPTKANRTPIIGHRNDTNTSRTGHAQMGGYYNGNNVVTGFRVMSNSGSSFTLDYVLYGKKIS